MNALNANERMAAITAVVVLVTGLLAFVMDDWSTTFWLAILGAAALLVIFFVPNISLPWSRGAVMLAIGLLAAAGSVIEALRYLGYIGEYLTDLSTILFLIAVAGSFVLVWTGWQAYSAQKQQAV